MEFWVTLSKAEVPALFSLFTFPTDHIINHSGQHNQPVTYACTAVIDLLNGYYAVRWSSDEPT